MRRYVIAEQEDARRRRCCEYNQRKSVIIYISLMSKASATAHFSGRIHVRNIRHSPSTNLPELEQHFRQICIRPPIRRHPQPKIPIAFYNHCHRIYL